MTAEITAVAPARRATTGGRYLIGLIAMLSCAAAAAGSCESDTAEALERLLERQTRGWAFVVVDNEASGGFVLFGGENGGVFIDLPTSGLSWDEAGRTAALFAEAGVRGPIDIEATKPDTREVFMVRSYHLAFGADAPEAARFGCRLLREVHRLPPQAPAAITEWAE